MNNKRRMVEGLNAMLFFVVVESDFSGTGEPNARTMTGVE